MWVTWATARPSMRAWCPVTIPCPYNCNILQGLVETTLYFQDCQLSHFFQLYLADKKDLTASPIKKITSVINKRLILTIMN